MASPTSKEVIDHLLLNVLLIDAENIKKFNLKGDFKSINELRNTKYKRFETIRDKGHCTMSCIHDISNYKMYLLANDTSNSQIMGIDSDSWEAIYFTMIRMNHALQGKATATTKPTVTVSTVTASQIESTPFPKYTNFTLLDKSKFINFYNNIRTQTTGNNMFFTHRRISHQPTV